MGKVVTVSTIIGKGKIQYKNQSKIGEITKTKNISKLEKKIVTSFHSRNLKMHYEIGL